MLTRNSFLTVLLFSTTLLLSSPPPECVRVDFDESMGKGTKCYEDCLLSKNNYGICSQTGNAFELYHFFRNNYIRHSPEKMPFSECPTIPYIAHWIWLGSPIPQKLKERIEHFQKLHPGWTCKIWTEKEVDAFGLKNRYFYEHARNWGEKANLIRYEVLERFGGVYLDWDMECLRPLTVLHHTYDLYCGLSTLDTSVLNICNAIIGARPHHPILQHCIRTVAQDKLHEKAMLAKLGNGVNPATGPIHFTKSFIAKANEQRRGDIALPATYFYPIGPSQKHLSREEVQKILDNTPESFVVHLWEGAWLAK